jgi:outer membrane protein OmpA-like peptidoglycan-associated protein
VARSRFNVWIAFADVSFVLFVLALLTATWYRDKVLGAERRANQAEFDRQHLREALTKTFRCAEAGPLFDSLSSCVAQSVGMTKPVQTDLCALTIREDLLRFAKNSAQPIDSGRARDIARCLYVSMRDFERDHPIAFDAIGTISIDGYTDCEGATIANMRLGSERGVTLFQLFESEMTGDQSRSAGDDRSLLSKLAVRSFGEQRPVAGSRCQELGFYPPDRHVTIAVDMRLQSGGAEDQNERR